MRFYLWVTRLLLKECDQFGEALSAFADLLRQPKVKGFENQWIFEGTRQHLEEKFSEGNFDQRREVLLRAGLELVDSQRLDETNIQRFLEQVDASLPDACAAVPLTSLVADRTEKCVT